MLIVAKPAAPRDVLDGLVRVLELAARRFDAHLLDEDGGRCYAFIDKPSREIA